MKLILITLLGFAGSTCFAADARKAPTEIDRTNMKLLVNRQTDGELANPRQFKELQGEGTPDEDAGTALATAAMDRSGFHNQWMKINSSCGFQNIVANEIGRKAGTTGSESIYLVSRTAECKSVTDAIVYLVKIVSPTDERKKATRVTWKLIATPFQP